MDLLARVHYCLGYVLRIRHFRDTMTTLLTTSERLEHADREAEELKQAYVDAVRHLSSAPEVDDSFAERWQHMAERLRTLRTGLRREDYDKEQLAELSDTFFEIRDLTDEAAKLDAPDHEILDRLLVLIERIRQVMRDALDEHVNGIEGDTGLIVAELTGWLNGIPKDDVAELLGINRRTLSRWAGRADAPSRRLRTVARVVAVLKHNWTEEGIVAWFRRPRRDLGGRTPLSLLTDGTYDDEALVMAARAGRSQFSS